MKKLLSIISTAAVLFGLAGCSGDLHDVESSPYSATSYVYVLGGIEKATIDTTLYPQSDFDSTKAYKIPVSEGKIKFEFVYTGDDSWSAGSGNQAFAIVADATSNWDTANSCRWMSSKDGIAVGSEGALESGSARNVTLTGLNAGTTYIVEADLTTVGGTLKLSEGLAAVPFELVWIDDDGKLANAKSITAVNAGTFSYDVEPADEAKTLKFIARYGNTYFFPADEETFTVDGTTASAVANTSSTGFEALKIVIPSKEDAGTVKFYRIFLTSSGAGNPYVYDFATLTASVRKYYNAPDETVKAVNSGLGNYMIAWAEPTLESCDSYNGKPCAGKLVYTGTVTVKKGVVPNWGMTGFAFGIAKDDGDWSTKYTAAVLAEPNTFYSTKKGDDANNYISANGYEVGEELANDIILTVKADVYKDVYESGKYSNQFDETSVKVAFKDAE